MYEYIYIYIWVESKVLSMPIFFKMLDTSIICKAKLRDLKKLHLARRLWMTLGGNDWYPRMGECRKVLFFCLTALSVDLNEMMCICIYIYIM